MELQLLRSGADKLLIGTLYRELLHTGCLSFTFSSLNSLLLRDPNSYEVVAHR